MAATINNQIYDELAQTGKNGPELIGKVHAGRKKSKA
jgi:hypothetical protein